MFKELEIMKALRYLLIAVTVLSVLSLSAQTRQYATTQSHEQVAFTGAYVNPQMPAATMDYRHSDYMKSGSTLPQAAVDGTTTTYDEENSSPKHHGNIRRWGSGEGEPSDRPEPWEDPIGDAGWMLLFCAAVFSGVIAFRRKRQQRNV